MSTILAVFRPANWTRWQAASISILAIIVALFLFGFVFVLAGINPLVAYKDIFSYAFANPFGLPLTINRFIFLLLCTYAFIIPYRAGLWNIGMTGQLYAGTLSAYAVLYILGLNAFDSTPISSLRNAMTFFTSSLPSAHSMPA